MAKRNNGIIAYGTEEDRHKLAILSQLTGKSRSEVIIDLIRNQYREAFGTATPEAIYTS